jgi:hypothetical protein
MKFEGRRWVWVLLVACLPLASCRGTSEAMGETQDEESGPATVEHLDGAEPTRVTLTEQAMHRLDIQTEEVQDADYRGTACKSIPYAAVLYDTEGNTWTYTNPEPLVYVRHHIVVLRIEGDRAFLSDGPDTGIAVVKQGAQELFGSEVEFEEE